MLFSLILLSVVAWKPDPGDDDGHLKGTIILVINLHLLGYDVGLKSSLLSTLTKLTIFINKEKGLILIYIMEQYANMRGTYLLNLWVGPGVRAWRMLKLHLNQLA